MRKWFREMNKIWNGNVEIHYDGIKYERGKTILYNKGVIVAEFGEGESIVEAMQDA